MTPKAQLQELFDLREEVKAQIEGLSHELKGIERGIARVQSKMEATSAAVEPKAHRKKATKKRRGDVKASLLRLLEGAGTTGLNAAGAVQLAADQGWTLNRGTVSSLLSKLKEDGALVYEGDRYKLKPKVAPLNGATAAS